MSYVKQNFEDGDILVAEQLNHIEDGISANDTSISQLNEDLVKLENTVLVQGKNLADQSKFVADRRADSDTTVRIGETCTDWIEVDSTKSYYAIFDVSVSMFLRGFGKKAMVHLFS